LLYELHVIIGDK